VKPLVYCTAGAASLLVWRTEASSSTSASLSTTGTAALVLYGCGLLLDVAWSPLLHAAKLVGPAAVDRALASVALGAALPLMAGVHPVAGALLLPLFAWECCGAWWSYTLWRLNRHHLREKRRNRHNHGYNTTLGEE
jgi:tryptophan-rich sensory protein